MRGDPVAVARPSFEKEALAQEPAIGAPDCRWIERVAALIPVPRSNSVQETVTLVVLCVDVPTGTVKVSAGAVLSRVKVIAAPVNELPARSCAVAWTV